MRRSSATLHRKPAAAWASFGAGAALSAIALAAPTQEDVFRSISDNVGQSTDLRKIFAFILGAAALVTLLAVFNRWRQREAQPKVLNHQGKLAKELAAAVSLKPAEMKQLKALADDQKVLSPMTLMLCPSLLAKAVKESGSNVDRRIVLQIARKIS
jgi:hypothetical protein